MGAIYNLSASVMFVLLISVEGQQGFYSCSNPPVEFSDRNRYSTGESCTLPSRSPGICTPVGRCRQLVTTFQMAVLCSYYNFLPIVCCPQDQIIPDSNVVQSPAVQPSIPQFAKAAPDNQPPPFTAIGARSRKACQEYYLMLKDLNDNATGYIDIAFEDRRIIQPTQRPHVALIGFGKKQRIYWRCSGSLISRRFVIAPGHCVASRRHGAVKWIMLGVVDPYDPSLSAHAQQFSIAERMPVTGFNPPSLHSDMTLLKLDRDAEFNAHVRPACISPRRPPIGKVATVPGWELVNWVIEPGHSKLMEVTLEVLPDEACAQAYKSQPRLDGHYSGEHLLCIGNHHGMTANCERDTGGPFHIQTAENLFVISGVVIFGNTVCERRNNTPVIATDVVSYLPWIEDNVWPLEGTVQRAGA